MSAPLQLRVAGVGLWSQRLRGWAHARDVLRGTAAMPDADLPRVAPAMLAPAERRRAPDTVAVALEAASAACAAAGIEPGALPSIFASAHGDLPISDYMCATLHATPRQLSPTRFHNSVHNAAAGYWTIGAHCTQPSTALAAWTRTFACGLLESATQAVADDTPVLYVAYDVAARGPLATVTHSTGLLALALVLAPATPAPGAAQMRAGQRRMSLALRPGAAPQSAAGSTAAWAEHVAGNAMAACTPMIAALADEAASSLAWAVGNGCHIEVHVEGAA